ncbi:hypothetical protein GSI_00029 [Ganoderma sinense ZZ0214-1]|uniref:Uncharacterized protein n=1 Tax=Ganoderma sinense ZZ0214-1 TaxID=1077348 RepID=A0A2G8SRC9_9APHY|nr:hypothetical protein GSI_00029 [Ganoderma sinense ZZ0214-1]
MGRWRRRWEIETETETGPWPYVPVPAVRPPSPRPVPLAPHRPARRLALRPRRERDGSGQDRTGQEKTRGGVRELERFAGAARSMDNLESVPSPATRAGLAKLRSDARARDRAVSLETGSRDGHAWPGATARRLPPANVNEEGRRWGWATAGEARSADACGRVWA